MKPLCVTAVVDHGYQEYLPLFLYFLFEAYPEYEAIIYFDGALKEEVAECLSLVRGIGTFEIKPFPSEYDRDNKHSVMALRWVIYDEDFARYENVYTGDVDLLTARESPSLCDRRVRHSEEIGLPYSNRVRPGLPRLSGLHFVRTRDYYARVRPVMEKYRGQIETGTMSLNNEEMLYRMMEESVGLPEKEGTFTVHHGIHLRVFRRNRSALSGQRTRTDYLFTKVFENYYRAFFDAARTELCSEIVERLSRISYAGGIPARYEEAGPMMLQQFETSVRLCRELAEEGEA